MKIYKVSEIQKCLNDALDYFNRFDPDAKVLTREPDDAMDYKSASIIYETVSRNLAKEGINMIPVIMIPMPAEMYKK
ncbi:MAG: hypothetical protein IJJ38_01090 [Lachnospiraceae bacterium]|nr:hypothetical protein [Lachnospiraceae bacterium]